MTAHQPHLDEAARTLVQWARTRQAGWRDPSADLKAALGNRYEALREPDVPPQVAPPQVAPPPVAPPPPMTPPVAVAPLPVPSPVPPPVVAPVLPMGARTAESPAPATAAPVWQPEPTRPVPVPSESLPAMGTPLRAAASASLRWIPRAAIAAAIILAVVAAPKLWKSYAPAAVVAPKTGTISLESNPPGSSVFIDGIEAGVTPLTKEIGAGNHSVEFRYKKGSRTVDVVVAGGQTATGAVDWTRKPVGKLQVSSDIAATKVYVDGKMKGNAPMSLEGLTAGPHTVMLKSAQGSVKQTITIKEGETAQFAGSIYPGSLHVSAPFELEVSEAGQLVRLDDKNEAVLAPGPHKLRFVNAAQGLNEERTVEIEPGKLASLTLSAPAAPAATESATSAVPGATAAKAESAESAEAPATPPAVPEPASAEPAAEPAR